MKWRKSRVENANEIERMTEASTLAYESLPRGKASS